MNWHTITPVAEGVYYIAEPFGTVEPRYGSETVNMYLVVGRDRAALIDTGLGIGDLPGLVAELTDLPCQVLNTHSHWDHVGGNHFFADTAVHSLEADWLAGEHHTGDFGQRLESPEVQSILPPGYDPARFRIAPQPASYSLYEGQEIDLGGRILQVIHTPGHSPGHVAFYDQSNGLLFTGDLAYQGWVFACFEGSDPTALLDSLQRVAELPDVRVLCPGHNQTITDPTWLNRFVESLQSVIAGQVTPRELNPFIGGRPFHFDTFSIWLP